MRGSPEFHDDVANLLGKPRVADQGGEEVFLLREVMRIANADKRMFLERGQDAVDRGTDGRRSPACRLRSGQRGNDENRHGHQRCNGRGSRHRASW